MYFSHVIVRCSVNMSEDSVSRTTTAMEGFLATLPGSATEDPVFMQVSEYQQMIRISRLARTWLREICMKS